MANDFSNFTERDTQPSEDSLARRTEIASTERRYFAESAVDGDDRSVRMLGGTEGDGQQRSARLLGGVQSDSLETSARLLGGEESHANADEDEGEIGADEARREYAATADLEKPKTLAYSVTALVFSVLSIICCCSGFLSCLFGILAIIFAVVSRGHLGYFESMAIVGLIIGIIGAILGLFVGWVTWFGIVGDMEILEQAFGNFQTNF